VGVPPARRRAGVRPFGSNKVTYAEARRAPGRLAVCGISARMRTNEAVAGNEANPEGDDLSNLQEYAFNTDPLASNTTRSVTTGAARSRRTASSTRRHLSAVTAASDITYRV